MAFSEKQYRSIRDSNSRINLWDGSVRSGKTIGSIFRWLKFVRQAPSEGVLLMTGKTNRTLERNVLNPIRFVGNMLKNGHFFVDKSCTNTQMEFASYVWDDKAQKRGEDKPMKDHDHCMDMVRYGLFTHFFRSHQAKLMGFNYE